MKIVTVCGMGLGTSNWLRAKVMDVIREIGIKADVDASDIGTLVVSDYDLIVASNGLEKQINNSQVPIILIKNILDQKELKEKISSFLSKKYFSKGGSIKKRN
jgi:PTS system ascorbate-specific IIB component